MQLRRAWNEIWPAQVSCLPTTSYLNSAKLYVFIKRKNRLITASIFNMSEAQKGLLNATGNGLPGCTVPGIIAHLNQSTHCICCYSTQYNHGIISLLDQGCVCMITEDVLLARQHQKL